MCCAFIPVDPIRRTNAAEKQYGIGCKPCLRLNLISLGYWRCFLSFMSLSGICCPEFNLVNCPRGSAAVAAAREETKIGPKIWVVNEGCYRRGLLIPHFVFTYKHQHFDNLRENAAGTQRPYDRSVVRQQYSSTGLSFFVTCSIRLSVYRPWDVARSRLLSWSPSCDRVIMPSGFSAVNFGFHP